MYLRDKNSIEGILTEYKRRMAPSDFEDVGIDPSTMAKAANPQNRRQLSFKDARKLEEYRHGLKLPLYLTEWFTDGLERPVPKHHTLPELIKHIIHAKQEGEDVTTMALNLLSDGDASLSDLKALQKENDESYISRRRLKQIIENMIEEKESA